MRRSLSIVVIVALTGHLTACAGSSDATALPSVAEQSQRLVTTEFVGTYLDEHTGENKKISLTEDEFQLGEYNWQARELLIDGESTLDVSKIREGSVTVVPLRSGGKMTLRRNGDVVEIADIEADSTFDRAKFPRLRIGDNTIEVLGADDAAGSGTVRVRGIEDLPEVERALTASLGLDILLASVEDSDTVGPAVIIAAVAAVVGAAWMTACGVTLSKAVKRCNDGFEVKCAFLDVDVDWPKVKVGGTIGFGWKCI